MGLGTTGGLGWRVDLLALVSQEDQGPGWKAPGCPVPQTLCGKAQPPTFPAPALFMSQSDSPDPGGPGDLGYITSRHTTSVICQLRLTSRDGMPSHAAAHRWSALPMLWVGAPGRRAAGEVTGTQPRPLPCDLCPLHSWNWNRKAPSGRRTPRLAEERPGRELRQDDPTTTRVPLERGREQRGWDTGAGQSSAEQCSWKPITF